MSRRRGALAALFSTLMLVVLAFIVYTERANASATESVWILVHDVRAGAVYASGDVQQVDVKAQPGDFNFEARGPRQVDAVYARSLSSGDIVRSDDLITRNTLAEVSLTVQNPPPLSAGDHVDVFATTGAGAQALIGRGLTIADVSGATVSVFVPASDEAAWVSVGASSIPLHLAKSSIASGATAPPLTPASALVILCGSPCGGAVVSPSTP